MRIYEVHHISQLRICSPNVDVGTRHGAHVVLFFGWHMYAPGVLLMCAPFLLVPERCLSGSSIGPIHLSTTTNRDGGNVSGGVFS